MASPAVSPNVVAAILMTQKPSVTAGTLLKVLLATLSIASSFINQLDHHGMKHAVIRRRWRLAPPEMATTGYPQGSLQPFGGKRDDVPQQRLRMRADVRVEGLTCI